MSFRIFLTVLLASANLLACETHPAREVSSAQLQPGGRSGLHGMVIFGKGSYFIEHIPMLHPPHDFQIVASITIKNNLGKILQPDLSGQGFTLKPAENFSLNDLIQGQFKSFKAEIYEGSFEQNGKLVSGLENVIIEINKIALARQLPDTSKEKFFEVTDAALNTFRTAIITPENNTQMIKNTSTDKTLWCVVGPDFFDFCP